MSTYQLRDTEHATQGSQQWLSELMRATRWLDADQAMAATAAALHTLRNHLSDNAASMLGAQLPLMIRCSFYEGWHAGHRAPEPRSRQELVAELQRELPRPLANHAEWVAREVFAMVRRHIEGRAVERIAGELPPLLRMVWRGAQVKRESA